MVQGLVTLHGGSVEAASDGPGRGSSFTVRLPLEPSPPRPGPAAGVRPPARSRRVLVIEDNPDSLDSLRDVLELKGYDVRVARDGPRGMALARSFRPEVVICDIGLPGMDGYQVARAFREDDDLKDTYLVALSGYARPDDLRQAAQAGFDRHVAKPSSLESLEQLLEQVP
jgi:CheY-like chemotaxis protein